MSVVGPFIFMGTIFACGMTLLAASLVSRNGDPTTKVGSLSSHLPPAEMEHLRCACYLRLDQEAFATLVFISNNLIPVDTGKNLNLVRLLLGSMESVSVAFREFLADYYS
jgi:hypothetical protein